MLATHRGARTIAVPQVAQVMRCRVESVGWKSDRCNHDTATVASEGLPTASRGPDGMGPVKAASRVHQ